MSSPRTDASRTTVRARRFGVVLAAVATSVWLAVLAREFPLLDLPVALGVLGGVGLVAVSHLGARSRGFGGGVLAGGLVAPAGLAVTSAIVLGSLRLVEATFPVEGTELLSTGTLVVLGHVGVVLACTVAGFGAALCLGGVSRDTLERTVGLSLAGLVAPVALVVVGLLYGGLFDRDPDALVDPFASGFGTLLALDGGGSLTSLLVLSALAAAAVSLALADTGASRPLAAVAGLVGLFGVPAVALWDISARGGSFGGTPVELATAHSPLRAGLLALALWPGVTALGALFGRLGWARGRRRLVGAATGGAVTTLAFVAVSGRVFALGREETRSFVPMAVEGTVDEWLRSMASFGEVTLVLAVVLAGAALAAWIFLAVQVTVQLGSYTTVTAGAALATVGLFAAGAAAGTVQAPPWLVAGLVGTSLLVWEVTRFDATLLREVGEGRVERVRALHLGGTRAVAACGVALALVATARFPQAGGDSSSIGVLALCSVVVGLLSLGLALR